MGYSDEPNSLMYTLSQFTVVKSFIERAQEKSKITLCTLHNRQVLNDVDKNFFLRSSYGH